MKRIESVTIIGVGLIGGSFALALKESGFKGKIVGCDRPEALREAGRRGAIDASSEDVASGVQHSELIVLAAPVGANLSNLSSIAAAVPKEALITDVGSTKAEITNRAAELFGADALRRFLPGHPMAGREVSGVQHASPELFREASWILTPQGGRRALIAPEFSRGMHREFIEMLESIGARVVVATPEKHDRILAFTSHLPQLVSTALANTVQNALGATPEIRDLSGRGLREMIRLAKSDPQLWAEITTSNAANIKEALLQMEKSLSGLRESLETPELKQLFGQAAKFDPDAEISPADDADPPHFG